MFAISFDLLISNLKQSYGEPYNNAYYEISTVLASYDFYRVQGSVYMTQKNDMANLFKAINALKSIEWLNFLYVISVLFELKIGRILRI